MLGTGRQQESGQSQPRNAASLAEAEQQDMQHKAVSVKLGVGVVCSGSVWPCLPQSGHLRWHLRDEYETVEQWKPVWKTSDNTTYWGKNQLFARACPGSLEPGETVGEYAGPKRSWALKSIGRIWDCLNPTPAFGISTNVKNFLSGIWIRDLDKGLQLALTSFF